MGRTSVATVHGAFVAAGGAENCANVKGSRTPLKPSCLMRQTMVLKSRVTLSVPRDMSPGNVSLPLAFSELHGSQSAVRDKNASVGKCLLSGTSLAYPVLKPNQPMPLNTTGLPAPSTITPP